MDWLVSDPTDAISDGAIAFEIPCESSSNTRPGPWNVLDDSGKLLASCVSLDVAQVVSQALHNTSEK